MFNKACLLTGNGGKADSGTFKLTVGAFTYMEDDGARYNARGCDVYADVGAIKPLTFGGTEFVRVVLEADFIEDKLVPPPPADGGRLIVMFTVQPEYFTDTLMMTVDGCTVYLHDRDGAGVVYLGNWGDTFAVAEGDEVELTLEWYGGGLTSLVSRIKSFFKKLWEGLVC